MKKKKRPKKRVFETFRDIQDWLLRDLRQDDPSCFNGMVRYRKYRVVIEEVEEPKEVLQERLQHLWDHMKFNYNHYEPMQEAAKELDYELIGQMGAKRDEG